MSRIRDARRDNLTLGLDVLRCLVTHRTSRGVTQVAAELKLPVSTTHDLLQLLRQLGFVIQDEITRRYRVSTQIFEFIQPFASRFGVTPETHEFIREQAAKHNVTIYISALWGTRTYVVCAQGVHGGTVALGAHGPAYASACAKVLIAQMPLSKWQEFAPTSTGEKVTDRTNLDPAVFSAELTRARADGVAFNEQESALGLCSIAAPLSFGSECEYALGLVYPVAEWAKYSEAALITQVKTLAEEISTQGFARRKPAKGT